jgi:TonB family protein
VTVAQQKEMEKKVKDYNDRKGSQKEVTVQVKDMGKPDIVPPVPINDVKGKYPEEMKDYNQVVIVILKLLISETGDILDIKVVNAKNAYFEREARNAAKKLKFKPALKNGIPVSFPVIYKVKFLPEEA